MYEIETNPNRLMRDGDILDNGALNAVGSPILEIHGNPTDEDVESVDASKIRKNSVVGNKVRGIPLSAFPLKGLSRGDSLIKIDGVWQILKRGVENDILHIDGWHPWITGADVGSTIYDGDLISSTNTSVALLKSNFTFDWAQSLIPFRHRGIQWIHAYFEDGGKNSPFTGIFWQIQTSGAGSQSLQFQKFNPIPFFVDTQSNKDIKIKNIIPRMGLHESDAPPGDIRFYFSNGKYHLGQYDMNVWDPKYAEGLMKSLNQPSGTKVVLPGDSYYDVQADFRFMILSETRVLLNGNLFSTPFFNYKLNLYGDANQTLRRFIVSPKVGGDNVLEFQVKFPEFRQSIITYPDRGGQMTPGLAVSHQEEGYGYQVRLIIQKLASVAVVDTKVENITTPKPDPINPTPNPSVDPPEDDKPNPRPDEDDEPTPPVHVPERPDEECRRDKQYQREDGKWVCP